MSTYLRGLGLAYNPGPREQPCSECNGAGYFTSDNGPAPRETNCEDCGGTGFIEIEEENEDMIDPQAIRDAAEAFILADAAYAAHGVTSEERKIDLAIAERSGDADAIAAAQAAKTEHGTQWHSHYMARQDTADALVRATGVDPRKLAAAIKRY